jgi:hypothetical protein
MKPVTLLLAGSLAANVLLVGWYLARSEGASRPANARPAPVATPAASGSRAADAEALRVALATGDAAALAAAGVSPDIARQLAIGRAFERYAQRSAAGREPATDGRWWRNTPGRRDREPELVARRELSDALSAALGHDPLKLSGGGDDATLSFLPPAKREALRRIVQDYDEMIAKFSSDGIQLPSDREKLDLLRAERDRDIAALLTPAERAQYEMRTSALAAQVRARYGDAIGSEAEFKTIYELQKAFDERFPREAFTGRISPELMQQRAEAERQLQQEIRAALGEQRYAELRRTSDPDLRVVDSLVSRLNLPAGTTDQIASARDSYAAASQRINSDATLTPQDRRTQIQELAARARGELAQTLGGEAADVYAQRSSWITMLQNGVAFTTDPREAAGLGALRGGGTSVFPVMPPRGAAVSGERQIFNFAPPEGPAPGGGGAFMTPAYGAGAAPADNVPVISVTTSGSSSGSSTPAAPSRSTNVAPGQPSEGSRPAAPQPGP